MGDYSGFLDLVLGLQGVTSVGKEDRAILRNDQHCRASGKSAQVANVRKVRNQQRIETVLRECALHRSLSVFVVHAVKCNAQCRSRSAS